MTEETKETEERLFLAIGFDEELCRQLEKDVKKVKINLDKAELGYKWVSPQSYHVTLVFLGPTPASRKEEIVQKLQALKGQLQGFELDISGVSAFSSERHARLIYCGVQNKRSLRELVSRIRVELGLEPSDSYSPHLSIARLRNPANVKDMISPVCRKNFFKVSVTEIRLYRSHLGGPYPHYEILERFPLTPL